MVDSMTEKEIAVMKRLLRTWGDFAKAMSLHQRRNGELADYDDELASDVFEAAQATLQFRDGAEDWANYPFRHNHT